MSGFRGGDHTGTELRGRTFPPEVLTRDEARALTRAPSKDAPTGVRNRALIALLWRGGLRIAEALALRPSDVDLERGTVRVGNGKGGKHGTVGIDDEALAYVARWMDRRRALGITDRAPLVCTLRGGAVSPQYVRAMLGRMAKRAGIRRRVNPHALRHTLAAELAEEGVPLQVIQKQLRHASLDGTAHYLQRIAPTDLVRVIRARPAWDG